jgi:hypothetical protein
MAPGECPPFTWRFFVEEIWIRWVEALRKGTPMNNLQPEMQVTVTGGKLEAGQTITLSHRLGEDSVRVVSVRVVTPPAVRVVFVVDHETMEMVLNTGTRRGRIVHSDIGGMTF